METYMKAILFTLVTLFSMNVMADQCQAIKLDEAERAAILIQKNSTITEYCEPCENGKIGSTSVVKSVKVVPLVLFGNETYYEVKVNGKSLDLAYTFLKVAPNRSVNVAKAVACSTLDHSSVSSVIDDQLNTIK